MKKMRKIIASVISVGVLAAAVGGYMWRHHPPSMAEISVHSTTGISRNNVTLTNLTPPVGNGGQDTHSLVASTRGKYYYTNRVVIVTFHDISPNVYSPWVITPE